MNCSKTEFLFIGLQGGNATPTLKRSPILDYERWARSWFRFLDSQPTGDISHKPRGRLPWVPLLSTRPAVTFLAKNCFTF